MSDKTTTKKRAKLPPLQDETEINDTEKRQVRKKKKKPSSQNVTNGDAHGDSEETPRKKKKTPVGTTTSDKRNTDVEKPTPRQRKQRSVKDEDTKTDIPDSTRSAGSQNENVTGSKASLITKDSSAPKKKKKKKRAAQTMGSPRDEDDWLTADLSEIQDDVITPTQEQEKDDEVIMHPYSTESVVLKSQPLDKLFIETNSGFKKERKTVFAKKLAEEEAIRVVEPEKPSNTTIAFAISTHNIFMVFCMFIHGITAGIALWHIVMTYILLYFDNIDFLEHYRILALPTQCLFYFLLVICMVSACDRNDIGYPTRRWVLQSLTLQTGTVAVLLYLASLICSLSAAHLEDKMNLYNKYRNLWTTEEDMPLSTVGSDINQWRDLNTARGILAIVAWIVLSITPSSNRFTENLRKGDDDFLGDTSVEMKTKMPV